MKKSQLPKKTCSTCKKPFFGEKNGGLTGKKLNIAQKDVLDLI